MIKIILNNRIRIENGALPPEGIELLRKRLTYKNPLFYSKGRYRKRYEDKEITPTLSAMWEDDQGNILIARGFLEELQRILQANRLAFEIQDLTRRFEPCGFDAGMGFQARGIDQWPEHSQAFQEMGKHLFGCLVGPVGSGKAMVACKLIGHRQVPTLVVASGKNRMYAWKEKVWRFLGLPADQIGLIGDGRLDLERDVTVATPLSLYKVLEEVETRTGFVIVDRCDRAALNLYHRVGRFNSQYTLGLADANKRSDRLTRLMWAYVGPRVYELPDRTGHILSEQKPVIKIRETAFECMLEGYRDVVSALCRDEARNRLVTMDILQTAALRSRVLVVSERRSQLKDLLKGIEHGGRSGAIIDGQVPVTRRGEIVDAFNRRELHILLGTSRSLDPAMIISLDVLIIVSPVRYVAGLAQLAGKLFVAKKPGLICDYMDKVEVLRASLRKRKKVFKTLGAVEDDLN